MAFLGRLSGAKLVDQGLARSLHNARSRVGCAGTSARLRAQSLLRVVRRTNLLFGSNEGMVGSAPIAARLEELVVESSGRAIRSVSRQGQCAIPHGQFPRHATWKR